MAGRGRTTCGEFFVILDDPSAGDAAGTRAKLHVRALVEYDGTEYYGFQVQAGQIAVQTRLEEVLTTLTGTPVRIRYAGRTDSGVHASGQVVAADVYWRHSLQDLERAWNARLPGDIAVRSLQTVTDPRFHPRFSAKSRVYQYTVWTAPWRSPLHARYAHHEPRTLNLDEMNRAASILQGEHDFASFGQATQGDSTVRFVHRASWREVHVHQVRFEIEANAYLRRMVRTVTGTLLEVGLGLRSVENVKDVLEARDRALVAPPAPACGLCLVEVKY